MSNKKIIVRTVKYNNIATIAHNFADRKRAPELRRDY